MKKPKAQRKVAQIKTWATPALQRKFQRAIEKSRWKTQAQFLRHCIKEFIEGRV